MKLTLPKFPRRSSKNIIYLGKTSDLTTLTNDSTAIILGQLVIMNIDEPPREGGLEYVAQPTRQSRRKDFSLQALRTDAVHIYSSIHPTLTHHITTAGKHTHCVLAVDAMIALAAKHKKNKTLLICNGFEAPDQTYFDTYLFQYGQLISITEAIIKPTSHMRYAIDVREQLQQALTEYPNARILWTPPLSPLNIDGYTLETTDDSIYNAKFLPVTHDGQTQLPSPKFPAIATVATLALCIGWGALDAATLAQKRAQYDALTHNNTADNIDLEMLQARAKWQTETDATPPEKTLAPASNLLVAISEHPEWKIVSLNIATQRGTEEGSTPTPTQSDASPLSATLTTAYTPGAQTPEEHIQPFIAALNQRTGMKLFVRQQGLTTDTQQGQLRVTLEIEK